MSSKEVRIAQREERCKARNLFNTITEGQRDQLVVTGANVAYPNGSEIFRAEMTWLIKQWKQLRFDQLMKADPGKAIRTGGVKL